MNVKKMKPLFLILSVLILIFSVGCGKSSEDAVYVQSVAAINNVGSVGINNQFSGVTVSGNTQEISFDESMTLDEILVEVGQTVNRGDVLFTYNNDALRLDIEQMNLEIETMRSSISSYNSQIKELERERSRVSDSEKLRYTLEIQGLEADIRETEYNLKTKEAELENRKSLSVDATVKAEISGKVTEINKSGEYDEYGERKPFMTIVETGNLRVKGTINEMNRTNLMEGQSVIIRSRIDDEQTWAGTITLIDWSAPVENNQGGYYYWDGDEMTTSSKYPFYVELENPEGLIIGQHVYIEAGGQESVADGIRLPEYYINDSDTSPWVWAASSRDKLEKRNIKLGEYDEFTCEYIVESGLTLDDYVAFPEDGLRSGTPVIKVDNANFDPGIEPGFDPDGEFEYIPDEGYIPDENYDGESFIEEDIDYDAGENAEDEYGDDNVDTADISDSANEETDGGDN